MIKKEINSNILKWEISFKILKSIILHQYLIETCCFCFLKKHDHCIILEFDNSLLINSFFYKKNLILFEYKRFEILFNFLYAGFSLGFVLYYFFFFILIYANVAKIINNNWYWRSNNQYT